MIDVANVVYFGCFLIGNVQLFLLYLQLFLFLYCSSHTQFFTAFEMNPIVAVDTAVQQVKKHKTVIQH